MKILLNFFLFLITTVSLTASLSEEEAIHKLQGLHSQINLIYGSLGEEYPEQLMATMFISRTDAVLELGGNVGRNSCVISHLLNNPRRLVVLESDPNMVPHLIANRNNNRHFFHIEPSALSQAPLIQSGWNTIPSAEVLPGYFRVNTISYTELKNKYRIVFSVLVADCEGALYHILNDDESVLEDVHTVIVENDYFDDRKKFEAVREKFIAHGFDLVFNKEGGWGPCSQEFYQVWKKPVTQAVPRYRPQ
jgi:FkbM family methyltransferase